MIYSMLKRRQKVMTVTLKCDEELVLDLRRESKRRKISVGELIREACEKLLSAKIEKEKL